MNLKIWSVNICFKIAFFFTFVMDIWEYMACGKDFAFFAFSDGKSPTLPVWKSTCAFFLYPTAYLFICIFAVQMFWYVCNVF